MRIATWNIGSLYKNIDETIPHFTDTVKSNNPDIICLQEFTGDPVLQKTLICHLQYPYHSFYPLSNNHEMDGTVSGFSVFSKDPCFLVESYPLKNPHIKYLYHGKKEETYDKAYACYSVCDNSQRFILITGHGIPFHRSNTDEVLYSDIFSSLDMWISDKIRTSHRWVIASDFNTEKLHVLCPQMLCFGKDRINGSTRPNGKKHDYIILPNDVEVHSTINRVGCFDHNYCMVDFDWR